MNSVEQGCPGKTTDTVTYIRQLLPVGGAHTSLWVLLAEVHLVSNDAHWDLALRRFLC